MHKTTAALVEVAEYPEVPGRHRVVQALTVFPNENQ